VTLIILIDIDFGLDPGALAPDFKSLLGKVHMEKTHNRKLMSEDTNTNLIDKNNYVNFYETNTASECSQGYSKK
jgi:hypothetical protein